MLKNINVPLQLDKSMPIEVLSIKVAVGDRVHRNTIMLTLRQDGILLPIRSQHNGWVRHIMIAKSATVSVGSLLVMVDVVDTVDYHVDPVELSADTELGVNGRRALDRESSKKFVDGFADSLSEAPRESEGLQQCSTVKSHPLLAAQKEGVPPKQSGIASDNVDSQEKLQANRNELKLGAELRHTLELTASPSMSLASSPRPGG